MEPAIADLGSHIEVAIGLPSLRSADFLDVLRRATDHFGRKPIFVLCDDPGREVDLDDAYRIGVDVASRFPLQPVAIVLRGRRASEADYFTELVAANRGARVRLRAGRVAGEAAGDDADRRMRRAEDVVGAADRQYQLETRDHQASCRGCSTRARLAARSRAESGFFSTSSAPASRARRAMATPT